MPELATTRILKVFVSSPSDVADERALSRAVVDQLQYDPFLREQVTFNLVAWDDPRAPAPLLAQLPPQQSISAALPEPSECDIVVVILWSRLGTPQASLPDLKGSPSRTGTEWEFRNALAGARSRGLPLLLLYRRTAPVGNDLRSPDILERLDQLRQVDSFFADLREADSGAALGGITEYETPDDFRRRFESDLRQLTHRLLEQQPTSETIAPATSDQPPAPPLWQGSPFPGLRAFTDDDAPIFFGRGRETDALLERVTSNTFTAVVGSSGSGKSSLVGAGLLARLRPKGLLDGDEWLLPTYSKQQHMWSGLRFTPGEVGNDPVLPLAIKLAGFANERADRIAARLRDDPQSITDYILETTTVTAAQGVLIFIDQFEEVFTSVAPELLPPFLSVLEALSTSDRARVVVTLRADFYHRCLSHIQLARLLEQGHFPLAAPDEASLLEMIERPADRAGLVYEPGLARRILADTGQAPGALPLLAYALDELYRGCTANRTLTFAAYESLGGVRGAIGARAEEVFSSQVSDDVQRAFPRVFRRLVDVNESGSITRRRSPTASLASDTNATQLVDLLTDARLLVQDVDSAHRPVIYVAHEALFESWPRLHDWLDLVINDLRLIRRVRMAAREWDDANRDPTYLWPQERLDPVYEMVERLQPELDSVTERFIVPEYDRLTGDLLDESKPEHQRRGIADRLVLIGGRSAPALSQALVSSDGVGRSIASDALVRLGSAGLSSLLEALGYSNPEVRLSAIGAIRRIQDPATTDQLASLLDDRDTRVRSVAAGAIEALGGHQSPDALARQLRDGDVDVRWWAAGVLGSFGEAAVRPLLESMTEASRDVRESARWALQAMGATAIRPLLAELRGPDPGNRTLAADALSQLGSEGHDALLATFDDADSDVRWRVLHALARSSPDDSSERWLESALSDPDKLVRRAAAHRAMENPSSVSVRLLIGALDDPDPEIALPAARALATRGPDDLNHVVKEWRSGRPVGARNASIALRLAGPAAVFPIVNTLVSEGATTAQRCADILGAIGDSAVPALLDVLADADLSRSSEEAATEAMGRIAAEARSGKPFASSAVGQPVPVRRGLALALGMTGDPTSRTPLLRLLADPDASVRDSASRALANLGSDALPTLLSSLNSPDPAVSSASLEAIVRLRGTAVSGLLQLLSRSDGALRDGVVESLTRIGNPAAVFGLAEANLVPRLT
jgi:HEAT repeat protein